MNNRNGKSPVIPRVRCAVYTRKSVTDGLEQEFNSLHAQRASAEAFIASQKNEGWITLPQHYDDGGFSGGTLDRPALARLLKDIEAGQIDCVLVAKLDRLSRSLLDFARLMETFDRHKVSFVSVTQQFNTTHSMGRLTLHILLSFAQFEREIVGERVREKIAAARQKGKWAGGRPVLGFDLTPGNCKLQVNAQEAKQVRAIFELYVQKQSLLKVVAELHARQWTTKRWTSKAGKPQGGRPFDKVKLYELLTNVLYAGQVRHKDQVYPGEHAALVSRELWQRVQRSLQLNGRSGGLHVRNKHNSLLKGLLFCKPCGLAMSHSYTVKNGRSCYRYYVCATACKQGWHACPSKSVPAEEIEQFVLQQIRAIGQDETLQAATLQQLQQQNQQAVAESQAGEQCLQRERKQLYAEIRKIAERGTQDETASQTLAELHEQVRRLEGRLLELRETLEEAEQQQVTQTELAEALQAFDPVWETLAPKEQVQALRLLIERIEYDGAQGQMVLTFHPTGIKTLGTQQEKQA